MMGRTRHCLVCNREYPRRLGAGVGGGFCSTVCEAVAWSDWMKSVRRCRFIACDCPGDRWHMRHACRKPRGLLDGRCLECGHFPDAHGWRRRSSWGYGSERAVRAAS